MAYVGAMLRLASNGRARFSLRAVAVAAVSLASVVFVAFVAAGAGCARSSVQRDPPASCSKLGDSCTYAPGKLGVCVEPVDGKRGLVCQSQH
jgi:hypothetical protein